MQSLADLLVELLSYWESVIMLPISGKTDKPCISPRCAVESPLPDANGVDHSKASPVDTLSLELSSPVLTPISSNKTVPHTPQTLENASPVSHVPTVSPTVSGVVSTKAEQLPAAATQLQEDSAPQPYPSRVNLEQAGAGATVNTDPTSFVKESVKADCTYSSATDITVTARLLDAEIEENVNRHLEGGKNKTDVPLYLEPGKVKFRVMMFRVILSLWRNI